MSIRQRSKGLQDLLAQLARFFRANETRISAEHVSKCLEHLPAIESSALDRLFILLHQTKSALGSELVSARGNISRPGWTSNFLSTKDNPGGLIARSPEDRLSHTGYAQENPLSPTSYARCNHQPSLSTSDYILTQEHQPSLPSIRGNDDDQPSLHGRTGSAHIAAPRQGQFDNQATSCSDFGHSKTLFQQPTPTIDTALPAAGLVALHQVESITLHTESDDDTLTKMTLATCREIRFAPSTKQLLENCKTNRGEFLRAIKEAKAVFPTGQGWEAAIATKKENADIRDLMRIYHRFECYNIYRHVVEAGFHTGSHWIRELRAVLVNKLCRDFPNRFQNQKTANKCLNWVDQGCRYHEWAEMFSETSDLGYLIALPSDISHSAYTSRCTKEQMSVAVLKFKDLGINEFVRDLELTELANHIAAKLRDMTGKKRKDVHEEPIQSSHKSPRLTPSSRVLALALQSGVKTPQPGSIAAANHVLFGHPCYSLMPTLAQEHSGSQGPQDENVSGSMMDDFMLPYDPFNSCSVTDDLDSFAYSELFMRQFSAFL